MRSCTQRVSLSVGILERLDLGRADARLDVALLAVELLDLFGVLFELRFLIGAAAGDPGEEPVLLGLLHPALQAAVADLLVADELDVADLDLRAFVDVEDDLDQLRAAGQLLDARLDLGELVALLGHQAAQDAFDAADGALIEERVEAQRDARLLHLLVDLGAVDLVGWHVVDDLDARALFHVEDDVLAQHAVVVAAIEDLDAEVVEEVGRPQPLEVLEQRPLGFFVERRPDAVATDGSTAVWM